MTKSKRTRSKKESKNYWPVIAIIVTVIIGCISIRYAAKNYHLNEISKNKPFIEIVDTPMMSIGNTLFETYPPEIINQYLEHPYIFTFTTIDTKRHIVLKNTGKSNGNLKYILVFDTLCTICNVNDNTINDKIFNKDYYITYIYTITNPLFTPDQIIKMDMELKVLIHLEPKIFISHILLLYEYDNDLYYTYFINSYNLLQPFYTELSPGVVKFRKNEAMENQFFQYKESIRMAGMYTKRERKAVEKYIKKIIEKYGLNSPQKRI